jgi:phosphate transport system protein
MTEQRRAFDRELDTIEAKVIELFGMVCEDWGRATDAWRQRDGSTASALAGIDDELDEPHASLVAELATGGMAPPVTMEMTLVARFYERLGDHAVNIARRVIYLAGSTDARPVNVSG